MWPTPLATGLHLVDSPVFDRNGNLYVTFSGSRGQQAPISLFVVRPDGTREPFAGDVPNPTSMAFDNQGMLYVSSRFDGSVHRITPDGNVSTYATDLGVACGIAFGQDDALYVGDRSGSILRVEDGRARLVATIPASVAAFHLAFGPDGWLYVTAPTLSARDPVYRISLDGEVQVFQEGFGRPQGLAFDDQACSVRRRCRRRLERRLPDPTGSTGTAAAGDRRGRSDRSCVRSSGRARAGLAGHRLPAQRAGPGLSVRGPVLILVHPQG